MSLDRVRQARCSVVAIWAVAFASVAMWACSSRNGGAGASGVSAGNSAGVAASGAQERTAPPSAGSGGQADRPVGPAGSGGQADQPVGPAGNGGQASETADASPGLDGADAGGPTAGSGPAITDAGEAEAGGQFDPADAGVPDSADGSAPMLEDECGIIPSIPAEPASPKAVVLYGLVEYHTSDANEFVGVHATLTVPQEPPQFGVIFVWPGTQGMPGSATYEPVGDGVLQPVLTWGSSCVPGSLQGHSTWWISPVYVNTGTSIPELLGCHGGPVIAVDVGDRLDLDMRLDGTEWDQTVVDLNSQMSSEFTIDLRGQMQQRAMFWIELKTLAKPTEDLVFEDIVLSMRMPEPEACELNNRGTNDYVSRSRVSPDGLHCCIDRIVLRAEGVPATTADP